MAIAAFACFVVGAIIAIVFGIQLLIAAFQTSIWWGLGYIFIPIVGLVFVISYWDVAKKPFLRGLISIPFYIAGVLLMPASAMSTY